MNQDITKQKNVHETLAKLKQDVQALKEKISKCNGDVPQQCLNDILAIQLRAHNLQEVVSKTHEAAKTIDTTCKVCKQAMEHIQNQPICNCKPAQQNQKPCKSCKLFERLWKLWK